MTIVVLGGTGLTGARLVERLRADGHDVAPAARSTGVDAVSGAGLDAAVAGAEVVVDVTNAPPSGPLTQVEHFTAATGNALAAEARAGVAHHVLLSIVGLERVPENAHYQGKAAQEAAVRSGPVPYTILRTTQFFEFLDTIAGWNTEDGVTTLAPVAMQPVALDEVVAELARLATGEPVGGVVELAGPQPGTLDAFVRELFAATGDPRELRVDPAHQSYRAPVPEGALLPGPGVRTGRVRLAEWVRTPAVAR